VPITMEYVTNPVISYNKTNETYTVTKEFVNNSALNHKFIEEILRWRRENGLR
jgi:hypothetical protein